MVKQYIRRSVVTIDNVAKAATPTRLAIQGNRWFVARIAEGPRAFLLAVCIVSAAQVFAAQSTPSPEALSGSLGRSVQWKSGWIDLHSPVDLRVGDKLLLSISGSANQIVVRLLSKGEDPDQPIGIVGGPRKVPPSRQIEVVISEVRRGVSQISVHGGESPFEINLGPRNEAATLSAASIVRALKSK